MNEQELRAYFEKIGYELLNIKEWKNHDWIEFANPPQITYGRLILTCHLEQLPWSTIHELFPAGVK